MPQLLPWRTKKTWPAQERLSFVVPTRNSLPQIPAGAKMVVKKKRNYPQIPAKSENLWLTRSKFV